MKAEDKYLYLAVDSTGQTIEFLLTAKRDAVGAKRFFRKALNSVGNPVPRVINVDKNPAYPAAVEALKAEGYLPRRVHLRQCKYLNNVGEQDHRTVKKRVWLAKGYGSFATAWRTLQGIEAVNMIRKGKSAAGGEERCDGSSGFHRRAVWHRCLTPSPGKTPYLVSSSAPPNLRKKLWPTIGR